MPSPTQVVNAARLAYEVNRIFCKSHGEDIPPPWDAAGLHTRGSVISGVEAICANPEMTPEDGHNDWKRIKLEDGWRWGESKDELAKTHPALVNYAMLPFVTRLKNDLFQLVVRAMMGFPFRD